MSEIASSEEPVEELHSGGLGEVVDEHEPTYPSKPTITFKGNTYDLMSLGSLITGALILFSCLTCNMGYYCLPFIPVVLGIVGVISARQSVEPERTKLWSWLGIGAGGFVLLILVAGIVLYIALLVVLIAKGELD